MIDDELVRSMAAGAVSDPSSPVQGDADELIAALGERRGQERLLDLMLRTGPYGDGFGAHPQGCRYAGVNTNLLAERHRFDPCRGRPCSTGSRSRCGPR